MNMKHLLWAIPLTVISLIALVVLLLSPTAQPEVEPTLRTSVVQALPPAEQETITKLIWLPKPYIAPSELTIDNDGTISTEDIEDVGLYIANFGIYIAETYGNSTGGPTNRLKYDNSGAGVYDKIHGYDTFANADLHMQQIANDELDYMNWSCIAFASYCQKKVLGDLVYYNRGCTGHGVRDYASVIECNEIFWPDPAAFNLVKEKARPGDILLYTSSDVTAPLEDILRGGYPIAHAELYIGPYGDWEYACVGSNCPGRDVYIKSLEHTLYSGHTRVFLISLADWLQDADLVVDVPQSYEEFLKEGGDRS